MKPRALLLFALAPLAAPAQQRPEPWEARAEASRESLDRGLTDWREELLQLQWRPQRDLAVLGGGRETRRYDQRDREAFAAAYLPAGSSGTVLHVEGTSSSTHRVLAKGSALLEVSQPFGGGWVVSAGGRLSRFNAGDTRIVTGTLEKYAGDYRLAYTLYLSRPDAAAWSPAHRLAASWYRSDLEFATIAAARGREVENVYSVGLVATDVTSASISGGIALAPGFGLTLEGTWVRQGDLYTRRGARLGARFLF